MRDASYRYAWGPRWPGISRNHDEKWSKRKGMACRILARLSLNSVLVVFQDGGVEIVSRNALRRMI